MPDKVSDKSHRDLLDMLGMKEESDPDFIYIYPIDFEKKENIASMIETYNADVDRVSLTGISMGGFGTWFTALAAPEKFSCIAPVCGGGMPWAASTLKMPIRAFHGDKDTVVSPSQSIDMIDQAQKTNPDALLTLYHNVGHNSWDYAYTDGLIAWLISNSRK
jgi:predicted peptidase